MKNRIGSTVMIGLFLILSLLYVSFLSTYNLAWQLQLFAGTVPDGSGVGEVAGVITYAFALFGAAAAMLMAYVPAVLAIIHSSVSLLFALRNRHSASKCIRLINLLYLPLESAVILFCIYKIIVFAAGIG